MTLIFNQLNADEQRIYTALQSVIDPEIGENLIDLGLVYGIHTHDHIATVTFTMTSYACPMSEMVIDSIEVTFTMTSYACPMSEMVIDSIEEAANKVLGAGMTLDLHLVWEPAWEPAMICAEVKQRLGWE